MWRMAIAILILIILAAFLFEAIGSKVTIGMGMLLWIILTALLAGVVGSIIFIAMVTNRDKK